MQDAPDTDLFDTSPLMQAGNPVHLRTSESACRYFVHLPNLSLDEDHRIQFRGGEVRSLAYDEWHVLDQEVAERRSREYVATRPAFFVVDGEEATKRVFARVMKDAQTLFSIMTLWGMTADPPGTSVAYAFRQGAVRRMIGVHDRRSILHGPVRYRLGGADKTLLGALSARESLVAAFDLPEVARVVQACSLGRGDDNPIDDIMRLTVALEALLLKDVTTGVTAAFVKRVGQFILVPGEVASELACELRTLYALRSDALHGRDWSASLAGTGRSEAAWAVWARQVLLRAANRVVGQVGAAADPHQALEALRRGLIP